MKGKMNAINCLSMFLSSLSDAHETYIARDPVLLLHFQQLPKAKHYSTSQHKINLPKTNMVPE